MLLRIFTEPQQGADYTSLLRVAQATEEYGFDAFFRSDHYLKIWDVSGLPGPSDAWVTLAALAKGDPARPARDPGDRGDVLAAWPSRHLGGQCR